MIREYHRRLRVNLLRDKPDPLAAGFIGIIAVHVVFVWIAVLIQT